MTCPNCKTPNQPNAKTCWSCGHELPKEATETIDRKGIGQVAKCPYCHREFLLNEYDSEHVKRTTDASHSRNKFAGKSFFRGNLMKFGIAGVLLIATLIVLGFVFLWDSKSIRDSGHKGVQLWEGGPYWAETNIGAENPWDSGYYFWWGDTVGYKRVNDAWVASDGSSSNFSFKIKDTNILTWGKGINALKRSGWITENGILAPKHDAAHVHWGGAWRMPTKQEFNVLNVMCDWAFTTNNGVYGWTVQGKGTYSSNSIFLPLAGYSNPFAGYGDETSLRSCCFYWSSVPVSTTEYSEYRAWNLFSDYCSQEVDEHGRIFGQSVRPVQGFTK